MREGRSALLVVGVDRVPQVVPRVDRLPLDALEPAGRDRSREIAHVLAAPDARASSGRDARGRTIGVIASASTRSVVVTLGGYDGPPSGRARRLRLMGPDARPRSPGPVEGDTPLTASGLDPAATSLAVTVEPDGGSPRSTSQPFVQLALKTVGFGE